MKKGKLLASLFLKIVIIGVCSTFYLISILQMLNSDKLVRDYMPLFTEFIFSFLALILSMSSVTIFANLNKNVRGSKVKYFFVFFLITHSYNLLYCSIFRNHRWIERVLRILPCHYMSFLSYSDKRISQRQLLEE